MKRIILFLCMMSATSASMAQSLQELMKASGLDLSAVAVPAPAAVAVPSAMPHETLAETARRFQALTEERHMPWDGLVAPFAPSTDGGPNDYTLSDLAIWSGIYGAAMAARCAASPGDAAATAALEKTAWGLHALAKVSGTPGLIARSIAPESYAREKKLLSDKRWHEAEGDFEGWVWEGGLSFDQYDGYLFGLAAVWPYVQDSKLKAALKEDARALAMHVIEHDLRIVGPDTFLDFRPNYFTQEKMPAFLRSLPLPPLKASNAAHGLHLMKVCAYVTGDPAILSYYVKTMIGKEEFDVAVAKYAEVGDWLMARHQKLIKAAVHGYFGPDVEFTMESARTPVGENLQHMALYDLARLEEDPDLRELYRKALKEAHRNGEGDGNTFWNFLYASQFPGDVQSVKDGVDTLKRFPQSLVYGEKKNSADPSIEKYRTLDNNFFKKAPADQQHWMARQPLPFERRPLHTSFAWQNNPYELDGGDNKTESSGTAFLIAYWLGRANSFIKPGE